MLLVVRRIANDVCEELGEADQDTLAAYFNQMGQVISWIGSGALDGASPEIREWLLPRAEGIQLALEGNEQLELFDEELVPIPVGVDSRSPGSDPEPG